MHAEHLRPERHRAVAAPWRGHRRRVHHAAPKPQSVVAGAGEAVGRGARLHVSRLPHCLRDPGVHVAVRVAEPGDRAAGPSAERLACPADLLAARQIVGGLNASAHVIETDFGRVDLADILGTNRFDFDRASEHPLWFKELHGFRDHVPETEEYGIRSFVYRARKPFQPARFKAFLDESWPGVIRAKGFFWLATRPHHVGEMSQAGPLVRSGRLGLWWASVPQQHWPEDRAAREAIARMSDPVWGDRRQELVFIGADPMDEADIRRRLDACLVEADGFEPARWANLPDPFPLWIRQAS